MSTLTPSCAGSLTNPANPRQMNGVVMCQRYLSLTLVVAAAFFTGCKEGADKFFSGRPSEMSMVHNRIIGGRPEAMVELLRVPSRYPDATESHVAMWQESVIAWWWHPEKHELMTAALGKLSPAELSALRNWVRIRDKYRSKEKAKALDEIEAALNATACSPRRQFKPDMARLRPLATRQPA